MPSLVKHVMSLFVLYFINRISALLHGHVEVEASQRGQNNFNFIAKEWGLLRLHGSNYSEGEEK